MNVFTEVVDDVTFVGYHKIESKNHKTFQILVRPDVSEDSLLTLAHQILITNSGAVTRHVPASGLENPHDSSHRLAHNLGNDFGRATPSPTNGPKDTNKANPNDKTSEKLLSPYLEAINSAMSGASLPWHTIRIYLGVNMDLQRCLVLVVQPTPAAAGTNTASLDLNGDVVTVMRSVIPGVFRGIGVNTYSHAAHLASSDNNSQTPSLSTAVSAPTYVSPVRKTFLDFCQQLAHELNTAMREESLTLDYMASVPASMTGPVQGIQGMYGSSGSGRSRALDSLIDLPFIRDLHCATAQLMTLRLLEQADKLDFRVKIIEQKCARLMTLLKPSYSRARLDLPVPPMSRSILSYDLVLERACLADSMNAECWKLILLRARRKCREILSNRNQRMLSGASSESYSGENSNQPDNRTESQIVLDCIIEQYVTWAQDEYKQRLFRKINSVKDRLETIHRFRIQLILNLHERFVVNGATNAVTSSSWFSSNNDLTYQQSVREKFPFLSLTEPVLFDTPAILLSGKQGMFDAAAAALNGKTGVMYLTLGYVMFYCGGGWGTAVEIEVVALRSVVLLEVVCNDGTLVSFVYSGDTSDSVEGTTSVTDTGGVGNDGREGLSIQQGDKSISILSPAKGTTTSTAILNTTNNTSTMSSIATLPVSNTMNKPIPPSGKQPNTIRLVDSAGTTDVTLTVTGLTDDYVRRVADLLDLIIKDKMYQLREPHPTVSTTASITNTPGSTENKDNEKTSKNSGTYHSISDIDDIMDLLALPSANNSANITTSSGTNSEVDNVSVNESMQPTSVTLPAAAFNMSTSTVRRTPALLATNTTIDAPVSSTQPAPAPSMADLEFDDLLLPASAPAPHYITTTTAGTKDDSTSATLNLQTENSQVDLDDFFKELTIHTPVRAHSGDSTSPTHTQNVTTSNGNTDVFDLFGSNVLLPTSGANTSTMFSPVSAYINTINKDQGLLGLQSTSAPMLSSLNNPPSVRSQSNNAISSIDIGLTNTNSSSKATNNKPVNDLFNDLLLTSMSTTSSTKRVSPTVASASNISVTKTSVTATTTDSVGRSSSIVRSPALLSTSSTATNPSSAAPPSPAAVTPPSAKPITQPPTVSVSTPTPQVTSGSATNVSNSTAASAAGEPVPAPVKKSLGGNIQKFLAQSQAQKAKQAADAAKK